ncbi:MAG: hypothetical protein DMG23_03940 [Acidobacteria bacterium]|nr:MAG: hypothetical protein DMG23_03940 [Acidobacteriota bacterium]
MDQAKKPEAKSDSLIARLSHQLAALEKRDWELWLIVTGTGILVGVGLLALIFPSAILRRGNVRMEIEVSRELFVSLVALLILFNTYIISRRLELRRTRDAVISATIQSELARLQSFTDPLTEVYNRRSLDDMAGKYMGRAKRLGTPLTFMVLDVDRFKEINTRFGHLTGDFVLAEIAAILTSAVRGSDAVVRYGGDEFLIILGEADLRGGQIVAGRIAKYSEDWSAAGHLPNFELTISIGLAEWHVGQTLDRVLDEADRRMFSSKETRKDGTSRK